MTLMIYTLTGFAVFFTVAWIVLWIIHIMALSYSKYKLHHVITRPPDEPLPGVSILKPLKGIDLNLSSNLETFFKMDYPVFEIIFCVEDKDDPAVVIVESLMMKFPDVDAKLTIGGRKVGVNPKINNMQAGYECSKYDFILISDSGIRMRVDTLTDMVLQLRPNVAIVHQMPFTCDGEGFSAVYEKVFFGTVQARMYLTADLLGLNCHTGMSSLVRKEALDGVGGLPAFSHYLAEDFFIAEAIKSKGWKTTISSQPAAQNAGGSNLRDFQARLRRWTKLRFAMIPLTTILEPVSECIPLGLAAAWSLGYLFPDFIESGAFFLVHLLMWFLCDWLLLRAVQNGPLPFTKAEFAVGWVSREICGPIMYLKALANPDIKWRSRQYRLDWGGRAHEVKGQEF